MSERKVLAKAEELVVETGSQKRASDPTSPINKQVWVNSTSKQLKTYTTSIKQIGSSYQENNPPSAIIDIVTASNHTIDWSLPQKSFRKVNASGIQNFTFNNASNGDSIILLIKSLGSGASIAPPVTSKLEVGSNYVIGGNETVIYEVSFFGGVYYWNIIHRSIFVPDIEARSMYALGTDSTQNFITQSPLASGASLTSFSLSGWFWIDRAKTNHQIFFATNASANVDFFINNTTLQVTYGKTLTVLFTDFFNQWVHIGLSWLPIAGETNLRIYINGVETQLTPSAGPSQTTFQNTSANMFNFPTNQTFALKGFVASTFMWFNQNLSATDFVNLYNAGYTDKPENVIGKTVGNKYLFGDIGSGDTLTTVYDQNTNTSNNLTVTSNGFSSISRYVPLPDSAYLLSLMTNGDFESGTLNNFVAVNSSGLNKWYVGTADKRNGTYGAYISENGGVNASYNAGSAGTSHLYRDIAITSENYIVSFWIKLVGEVNYDFVRIKVETNTTLATPIADTDYNPNTPSVDMGQVVNKTNFTNYRFDLFDHIGKTVRLVISWKNDNSVRNNPPAIVDDFYIGKLL